MSVKRKPRAFISYSDESYDNFLKGIGFDVISGFDSYNDIDLMVFTGGNDINPNLYGDVLHNRTSTPNRNRDITEVGRIKVCKSNGIPMFGICRGAQLLCAMSGGKLVQHIGGHVSGSHFATLNTGQKINVTSSHHQMMDPRRCTHRVLATSTRKLSSFYETGNGISDVPEEYEAVFFPNSKALAVQFHPEWVGLDDPQAIVVRDWVHNLVKREGF